jgi:hypothetical protein
MAAPLYQMLARFHGDLVVGISLDIGEVIRNCEALSPQASGRIDARTIVGPRYDLLQRPRRPPEVFQSCQFSKMKSTTKARSLLGGHSEMA